jgi:hypothetical protein
MFVAILVSSTSRNGSVAGIVFGVLAFVLTLAIALPLFRKML